MNKYIFFYQYYKAICSANYDNDERAIKEAERLSKELGEIIIVCRHVSTVYTPEPELTTEAV